MSFENCTCHQFIQPLDHFASGAKYNNNNIDPLSKNREELSMTLKQRYCVYNGYENASDDSAPIFFYTGNESPLETYVNHTGLMWTLAPKYGALVVFAEHRYEGESVPSRIDERQNCMSYCSSSQALADYARLISFLNPGNVRPVVAFGGSYGGMLSSWMRMKYPSSVAGAIAASAPIWATPLSKPPPDAGYTAISRGVLLSDEGDQDDENGGKCYENALAVWPLMVEFAKTEHGREILNEALRLCPTDRVQHEKDAFDLIDWARAPWFPLSEGNYPFESNYMTFALHKDPAKQVKLPKWTVTEACHVGGLNKNTNVELDFHGDKNAVNFDVVVYDESNTEIMRLHIDWDNMASHNNSLYSDDVLDRSEVRTLFEAMRDAVGVWLNATKDEPCYHVKPASYVTNDAENENSRDQLLSSHRRRRRRLDAFDAKYPSCSEKVAKEGSWNSICCNENLNLPIDLAHGMGNDFFWPPSHARNATLTEMIGAQIEGSCPDTRDGRYGYPSKFDPWSRWVDDYYGGLRIHSHSNIVFSHGLLDPWSGGGVYPGKPPSPGLFRGASVLNVTDDGSVIALLIDQGGHHLDLFFESEDDPASVTEARRVEDEHIGKWIKGWSKNVCFEKARA